MFIVIPEGKLDNKEWRRKRSKKTVSGISGIDQVRAWQRRAKRDTVRISPHLGHFSSLSYAWASETLNSLGTDNDAHLTYAGPGQTRVHRPAVTAGDTPRYVLSALLPPPLPLKSLWNICDTVSAFILLGTLSLLPENQYILWGLVSTSRLEVAIKSLKETLRVGASDESFARSPTASGKSSIPNYLQTSP
ncbi:hypothetical protein K438DRAFT_1773248 [Mycena galopus ATCC 62051]|nr:hypothetical protein K438DRAFT_1773248 [Mycena galopus ATCC 62051]